ncbi:MAG TPA: hypothetical protein VHK67_05345 [Rhabdochlamydiaceae bacterium]|nr:hypothetical protein [Rhabdochlamydiaceae bacterium]
MSSCAVGAYQTSIVVAAYIAYSMDNKSPDAFYGRLNGKVSLIETGSALIGFFGTAAMRSNFLKLDQETSDHFFYSLLGLGVMGLVLKLIHFYQNNQLLRNCSDEV